MPRPLSDSWQYFELLPPDHGRSRKARCTFCGHEQAAGITRLHQHLLYRCARISPDTRDELRQKQEDRSRDASPMNNHINGSSSSSSRNDLSITSRQQSHHIQFQQPSHTVDHHFDPTLQNALSSNNTTTITHSNSSSNNSNHRTHDNDNSHSGTGLPSYYEAALTGGTTTSQSNFSTTTNSFTFSPSPGLAQQTLEQQPRILQQPIPQQHSAFSSLSASQAQTPQDESPQALLDWHLARALFSANIPFEAIENPYMIDFLRHLQPNYVVPKGRQLKQYLLKEQHWDLIRSNEVNDINHHHHNISSSGNLTPTPRLSSSSTTPHDWNTSSPLMSQQNNHHNHHPPPRHSSSASSSNMGRMVITHAAAAAAAAAASANPSTSTTSNASISGASQPAMDDHILSSMHPTTTIDNNQNITSTLSTN